METYLRLLMKMTKWQKHRLKSFLCKLSRLSVIFMDNILRIEILSYKIYFLLIVNLIVWKLLILAWPFVGIKTWKSSLGKKGYIKKPPEQYLFYHFLVRLHVTRDDCTIIWRKMWYLVSRNHIIYAVVGSSAVPRRERERNHIKD